MRKSINIYVHLQMWSIVFILQRFSMPICISYHIVAISQIIKLSINEIPISVPPFTSSPLGTLSRKIFCFLSVHPISILYRDDYLSASTGYWSAFLPARFAGEKSESRWNVWKVLLQWTVSPWARLVIGVTPLLGDGIQICTHRFVQTVDTN